MSSKEKNLYKQITVKGNTDKSAVPSPKAYRGCSTVNPDNNSFALYDIGLIKQDIINNFHIRQGEKLSDPEFGTIIWDILFEPLTDPIKDAIVNNVSKIVNYDPRVQVDQITVDSYETGIQVDCTLVYLPYNISESMRLTFDENAGFITE